jgi:hypothetical protein
MEDTYYVKDNSSRGRAELQKEQLEKLRSLGYVE